MIHTFLHHNARGWDFLPLPSIQGDLAENITADLFITTLHTSVPLLSNGPQQDEAHLPTGPNTELTGTQDVGLGWH